MLVKVLGLVFKLGLGGRMGSGRQYWPWIGLRDEVDAIRFLLTADVSGPVPGIFESAQQADGGQVDHKINLG